MLNTPKIKLVALALIYVLHMAFFDGLMCNGALQGKASFFSTSHQQPAKNNLPAGSSYRLLIKHEQAKQALVSLPDAADFVSATFGGFTEQQIQLPRFDALARLSAGTFKLYRLHSVFLI